jgi:hypothetical protein
MVYRIQYNCLKGDATATLSEYYKKFYLLKFLYFDPLWSKDSWSYDGEQTVDSWWKYTYITNKYSTNVSNNHNMDIVLA